MPALKAEWMAESLRLTGFNLADHPISQAAKWADVTGREPETRLAKPAEGLHKEEGPLENHNLSFVIRPSKFDWILRAKQSKEDTSPWIGLFDESLKIFVPVMHKWLNTCPPLRRVAFGAVLASPVENLRQAHKVLAGYIPSVQIDADTSRDFLYQINRRRESKAGIPQLQINRLSKWSSPTWVTMHVAVTPDAAPHAVQQIGTPVELLTAQLELDINTVQEYKNPLPSETLSALFDELVAMGKEIAEKGDIK